MSSYQYRDRLRGQSRGLLENALESDVSFEAYIRLLQVGLVDNGLGDTRVLKNVLTEIRVELEDVVGGMALLARGSACVRIAFRDTATVVFSR